MSLPTHPDKARRIAAAIREGVSPADIRERFGVSARTMRRIREKHNLESEKEKQQ